MNQIIVDNNLIHILVDKYSDMLFRIAYQNTNCRVEAEEIMQNAFLAFMECKKSFNSEEHIKAWLIRVALNKSKDYLKSARRNRNIHLEEVNEYIWTPSENEIQMELDKLSSTDRTLIYLFYFENYNAREISAMLNMNENTVYTRLKRAKEQLRAFLEEENYE